MLQPVRLTVSPAEARARPGDSVTLTLALTNVSDVVDRFHLAVSGLPAGWYDLKPDSLSLFPDAAGQASLTLSPPAGTATNAGTYPLTITATSETDPALVATSMVTLLVSQTGGVRLELSPPTASGRQATYQVTIRNDANAPVTLSLIARDLEDGLLFSLGTEEAVRVPPGEQRAISLRVRPTVAASVGQPHPYTFEIRGVPEGLPETGRPDPALVEQATFTYVPRVTARVVPRWLRRLPVWALLLALLALLALAFMAGTRTAGANQHTPVTPLPTTLPTTVPTGTAIAVGATATAIGVRPQATIPRIAPPRIGGFSVLARSDGTVTIGWTSTDAKTLRLDGKPVPPSGQETVPLTGPRTLVLSAANAGGAAIQTLMISPAFARINGVPAVVAPYLPVIVAFTAGQGRGGTPVLRWQVKHADTVLVDGQRVAPSSERALARAGPVTHTLAATNHAGTVATKLVVPRANGVRVHFTMVSHFPRIDTFTLMRGSGGRGATLAWATSGARQVLLNGKQVAAAGSLPLAAPRQGTVYDLVAGNQDGASQAQVRVQLQGGGGPAPNTFSLALPRIVSFSVHTAHGRQEVSWQVTGARQIRLDGTPVAGSGSQAVPAGLSTLTLMAGNDVGTQQRRIPVVGPTPTFTDTPTRTNTPTTKPTAPPAPTARPTASKIPTATPTAKLAPPTATATRRPTRTPSPRPGAPSATRTPVPTLTAVPTAPPPPTSTRAVPTATPVPTKHALSVPTFTPTPRASPSRTAIIAPPTWTRTPSSTRTPRPANTWTRTPTAVARPPSATPTARPPTSTHTPVPPTKTPTAVPPSRTPTPVPPTSTVTPFPPTSTNTPVPPTSTFTPVPPTPTYTPVPPTSTYTRTPTDTPVPTSTATPSVTPTNTPLPNMSIKPTSARAPVFVDANVGPVTFTLMNNGPGNLGGINLTVTPQGSANTPGFSISGNGCTGSVAPGSSCTFDVKALIPCNGPNFDGSLTVDAAAANSPLVVQLHGQNGC